MDSKSCSILIDPSYEIFNGNKLFGLTDPILNRDGQLTPFHGYARTILDQGRPP